MAKATFDKSRSLTLYARCNETPIPKIFTFVNEDGTDHAIASYDFEFRVYNRTSSSTALFTLTIGSGLTVQNTNELLISPTLANATRDPDTHFWTLYSDTEDATWLNGPFVFHRGEFDGVDESDTLTITENGTVVEITVSSSSSEATQSQVNTGTASGVYVSPATLRDRDDTEVALVDGATIDITGPKHTLSTATGRTFTISHAGDGGTIEITQNSTSATHTFPTGWKCWAEGVASGGNTLSLSGASGNVYVLAWFKVGSNYYVASKNSNQ